MNQLLASLLLVTSLPLMAQVYTYTDAQGNPVFTNEPPPEGVNAQTINVPPANGADVPAASNYAPASQSNQVPPPPPPASQQQTSDANYPDVNVNADDDDGYYGADYDRRRAAEAAAINRRSNPVMAPVVNAPVINEAAPSRIEVPDIRR